MDLNEEFVKINFGPKNETHLGAVYLEVFKDISNGFGRGIVETPDRKYVDMTINACKWLKNQRVNFLIYVFENHVKKHYNPELFKCPLKKGKYIMTEAREIITNPEGYVPKFIPMIGNITLTGMARTLINKKFVSLGNITETYEFY